MNRFFRAEALTADNTLCSDNESNNRLAYFIAGCLLNDAANKINTLVDEQVEKNLLDRIAYHYNIDMSECVTNNADFLSLLQKECTRESH